LPTPKNIDRRRPALKIIDGATSLFHRRFLSETSFQRDVMAAIGGSDDAGIGLV
jgi:hypothetical protein